MPERRQLTHSVLRVYKELCLTCVRGEYTPQELWLD